MAVRFQNPNSTPPGGTYECCVGDDCVSSRNRYEACRLVRDLRRRHGLPVIGDGMRYIMEFMCPRLPDGYCNRPSGIKRLLVDDVKRDTAALFQLRCAPSDDIERRMEICSACDCHTRRGFCVDCTGLLDWIYRSYGPRRGRLPADNALGVCLCDGVLAAAGATPAERPLKAGAAYPGGCWRISKGGADAV